MRMAIILEHGTFKGFQSVLSIAGLGLELNKIHYGRQLDLHRSHKFKICTLHQLFIIKELIKSYKAYIDGY